MSQYWRWGKERGWCFTVYPTKYLNHSTLSCFGIQFFNIMYFFKIMYFFQHNVLSLTNITFTMYDGLNVDFRQLDLDSLQQCTNRLGELGPSAPQMLTADAYLDGDISPLEDL